MVQTMCLKMDGTCEIFLKFKYRNSLTDRNMWRLEIASGKV